MPSNQPSRSLSSSILLLSTLLSTLPIILLLHSSHSGSTLSPHTQQGRYGDYEAHRRWTTYHKNLDFSEYYTYSLDYWGLDYPPFALYLHSLLGEIISHLPNSTTHFDLTNLGYTGTVLYMRLLNSTIYLTYLFTLYKLLSSSTSPTTLPIRYLYCALTPLLPLIDLGHFQISNSLPLLLTLLTIFLTSSTPTLQPWSSRTWLGCIAFMSGVGVKQMNLYFSVVVFAHLLGWAMEPLGRKENKKNRDKRTEALDRLSSLALPVILMFLVLFLPFILTSTLPNLLTRLFPSSRGAYESKVGSLWCILDVKPVNVTERIGEGTLKMMALGATVLGTLPFAARSFLRSYSAHPTSPEDGASLRETVRDYGGCGLAFYLFSWHVHEKTVLMPMTMIMLHSALHLNAGEGGTKVKASNGGRWTRGTVWVGVACWSNGFLMELDGITWEYTGLMGIWAGVVAGAKGWGIKDIEAAKNNQRGSIERIWTLVDGIMMPLLPLLCLAVTLASTYAPVEKTSKYPDIYELLRAAVMFINAIWGYGFMLLSSEERKSC